MHWINNNTLSQYDGELTYSFLHQIIRLFLSIWSKNIKRKMIVVKTRGGSSLYPTRLARLDSTTESGPGSTRPAREAKMLRLNWLEASLFRLELGRFFMKNDCISF